MTEQEFSPRPVFKVVASQEVSEGAGAKVYRSIGSNSVPNFTPFLIVDHFKVKPEGGFPDHPHRGQETITYMIQGRVDHEDFTGSKGTLEPGDLQFMTAGKGIVHAEMPRIDKDLDGNIKLVEGLQIWVDLPANQKHCKPRYKNLKKDEIPQAIPNSKVKINVISGESYEVQSANKKLSTSPLVYYDCFVEPGGSLRQLIPEGFNAFLYILTGDIKIHNRKFTEHQCILFHIEGEGIVVNVPEAFKRQARFVIVASPILKQKIVQRGPFVETTEERIRKAIEDYDNRRNGFERASGWQSEIGKRKF